MAPVRDIVEDRAVRAALVGAEDRATLERLFAEAWSRLESGRTVYGVFNAATDRRDMRREAREELLDAILYLLFALMQLEARA